MLGHAGGESGGGPGLEGMNDGSCVRCSGQRNGKFRCLSCLWHSRMGEGQARCHRIRYQALALTIHWVLLEAWL